MRRRELPLKVAAVGPGFWAQFQVRAWRELERQGLVQLVALCGRIPDKLERLQREIGPPLVPAYTDLQQMLHELPQLDIVDLITPTPTHCSLTKEVLAQKVPVIVQKPMAQTLSQALEMVRDAQQVGVELLVHEDFRWQKPFVELKRLIRDNHDQLGSLIDIRADWESGGEDFLKGQPYFASQPALVNGEVGVHLIDIMRFLSGRNVTRVTSAHMHRGVDGRYRGEDIAHVTLDMQGGISAAYRVAFSAAHRDERPPQTFVRMVFQRGSIELRPDYEVTVTLLERGKAGGITKRVKSKLALPDKAPWTQDASLSNYQSWIGQWESCLPTNRACAEFIYGRADAGGSVTTGSDNINVLATNLAAYLAHKADMRVRIPDTHEELAGLAARLDEARIGYPEFPIQE